jgi:dynein heavy chain
LRTALRPSLRGVFFIPSSPGDNPLIPGENIDDLVEHVVLVHQSVGEFSKQFLQKLRRSNYVTPKNYLDFINTYSKLLDEKTQYNIGKT